MIKKLLWNSLTKTLLILLLCSYGTYYMILNHSEYLISLVNWRNKEFWTTIAIVIPAMMLFPTLINGFFFLAMMKISDNTQEIQTLLQKQNELLQNIVNDKKK